MINTLRTQELAPCTVVQAVQPKTIKIVALGVLAGVIFSLPRRLRRFSTGIWGIIGFMMAIAIHRLYKKEEGKRYQRKQVLYQESYYNIRLAPFDVVICVIDGRSRLNIYGNSSEYQIDSQEIAEIRQKGLQAIIICEDTLKELIQQAEKEINGSNLYVPFIIKSREEIIKLLHSWST